MSRFFGADDVATPDLLGEAVHRNGAFGREGALERVFTLAFRQLVYAQIWEDPLVDLEALELTPQARIAAIASGGCNILSYLTHDPAHIAAVDLNPAHVALNKLKIGAAKHLPDWDAFYRMFGNADDQGNVEAYDRWLAPHLDDDTRSYWEGRDILGRRRIARFGRNIYHYGLLGRFIRTGHMLARLYGKDPRAMMRAATLAEQDAIFRQELAPLFDKKLVRLLLSHRASLFGLGIPPAQYEALAAGRPMHEVVRDRLQRLACDYPLPENYFAWQAFNRSYSKQETGPLPPYLERRNFQLIKTRVYRVSVVNVSMTRMLAGEPAASFDRYVLLDAQDWMSDVDLTRLWQEITRTARPGARVIFRTAAEPSVLPGRIPPALLDEWTYERDASLHWSERDRSAIYGGFHLYVRNR